jgi:hypothetical protein
MTRLDKYLKYSEEKDYNSKRLRRLNTNSHYIIRASKDK